MKTLRAIKEQLEIPSIGQTLSRALMPQLDDSFLKYLDLHNISYTKKTLDTSTLKSTQSEFDVSKIMSLMHKNDNSTIYVSNDNYVLDGHHRWIADHNTTKQTDAWVIDLPILELLRVAKEHETNLTEEITHEKFGPMMDSFVSFASEKLGLLAVPKISYKNDEQGEQPSFGGYNPHTQEIVLSTKNRHPMDVFRTLAHELVHHKQNEDGRIKNVEQEGSTGSPIEDEANSMAGRIMRWFAKANPNSFTLTHIVEGTLKPKDREWGTDSLANTYADDTPGQRRRKRIRRKKIEEDGVLGSTLDMLNTQNTLPVQNSVGPEFGNRYPGIIGSIAEGDVVQFKPKSITPKLVSIRPWNPTKSPIHPASDEKFDPKNSVHQWHNSRVLKPSGPQSRISISDAHKSYTKFMRDHQDNKEFGGEPLSIHQFSKEWKNYAELKTGKSDDGAAYINASLHTPPSVKDIREAWESRGGRDMGTVSNSDTKETVEEERPGLWHNIRKRRASGKRMRRKGEKGAPTEQQIRQAQGLEEDWQKVNRNDKTDGLSQKAVNAYRRENPGSKLKTAVTEKNPKGSRAKRRLSFCRRMSGMKKRLTSDKTARDPDSRINKALRRWNCEE